MEGVRIVHDPGAVHLRRGLRAAVVVPVLYASLSAGVGATAALYASFASFASLVFADFQGTTRRRLTGYGALAALGSGLILLGSLVADLPALPAVAIFVVTFCIRFVGCLGGYTVAAGTTLMLAFALAVMSTPVTDVDGRVLGWVIGCAAAAAASMVAALPRRSIAADRVVAQCRALADHLRARASGQPSDPPDVTPVRQVREELALSSARPMTATASQTALHHLLDSLGRATILCRHLEPDVALPHAATGLDRLAVTAADTFEAAARAVTEGRTVDVEPVEAALTRQRHDTMDVLAGADEEARATVEREAPTAMRLRFITSLSAITAATAATWKGHRPEVDVTLDADLALPRPGLAAFWQRARRTLAFHLRWSSTRFRNSLRAAVALAASLGVARLVEFDHAFWVVLGTLMVLRSAVNDTATTALQALRGTLIGFAVAAPIAYVVNGSDGPLWVLLPLVTFLAAWAPGAVGLGTGQAAFTIFVVVLFNLAAPAGTQTAVIRVETVATGIAVAVVAGFLFWPRGPEAGLAPIAARLYRTSGALLRAVSADSLGVAGSATGLADARREAMAAREQLEETLQELAADRRADVELDARVAMLTPPNLVRAGDWSRVDLAHGTITAAEGRPDTPPPELEAEAFEVATRFDAVAVALTSPDVELALPPLPDGDVPGGPLPSDPVTERARPHAGGHDPAEFLRLVWLWTWLGVVDRSLRGTAQETVRTVRSLPRHWWR